MLGEVDDEELDDTEEAPLAAEDAALNEEAEDEDILDDVALDNEALVEDALDEIALEEGLPVDAALEAGVLDDVMEAEVLWLLPIDDSAWVEELVADEIVVEGNPRQLQTEEMTEV